MNGRLVAAMVSVLFSILVGGCAPWNVVRQTRPSPFTAQTPLVRSELGFERLMIYTHTEAQYLANKPSEAAQQLKEQKLDMQVAFREGMTSRKGPMDLVGAEQPPVAKADDATELEPPKIEPRYAVVTNLELFTPGQYNGFLTDPTELRARMKIADPQGKTVDEVLLHCLVGAGVFNPTVKGRIDDCARQLGIDAGSYLRQRLGAR